MKNTAMSWTNSSIMQKAARTNRERIKSENFFICDSLSTAAIDCGLSLGLARLCELAVL